MLWYTVEVRGLRTTFRSQFLPSPEGCRLACLYSKCFCLLSHLAGLRLRNIFLCALWVVCVHSVCSGAFTRTGAHVCRLEVRVNSFSHSIKLRQDRTNRTQSSLKQFQGSPPSPSKLQDYRWAAELHPMLT